MSVNRLRRWLARMLARRARPHLRGLGVLQTVKHKPAVLWQPGGERVLVLAPHPDDEVIGCGGAIATHVRSGGLVRVVYLTDGRHGDPGMGHQLPETASSHPLVETRRHEAIRAMAVLGVTDYGFLNAEEERLAAASEPGEHLRAVFESFRPELVYLPWFLEEHPDHAAVSPLVLGVAHATGSPDFQCCAYEVWTPLIPNCLVDIDRVQDLKWEALAQYRSQLAAKDYVAMTRGLNAYRAGALLGHGTRFAEAFLRVSLPVYRELYESCGLRP